MLTIACFVEKCGDVMDLTLQLMSIVYAMMKFAKEKKETKKIHPSHSSTAPYLHIFFCYKGAQVKIDSDQPVAPVLQFVQHLSSEGSHIFRWRKSGGNSCKSPCWLGEYSDSAVEIGRLFWGYHFRVPNGNLS